MLAYLKLIRFENLIIIALAQICIRYGLFEPFEVAITLNGFGIFLLVMASILIAAAGNIIINQYDEGDLQHSKISEKITDRLFMICSILGVCLGFYLSNIIGKPGFAALFIIVSAVFYIYATYLREIIVVRNMVIGILAALSILVVGIFDLLPAITEQNKVGQKVIFSIVVDYAIFGFIIIVLRELLKDCVTIDRDHKSGAQTIPLILGKQRTLKLVGILTLIPIVAVVYYSYTYLFSTTNAVILALLFLIAPMLFIMIKSFSVDSQKQIKTLILIFRIILVIASLSLLSYQYILK